MILCGEFRNGTNYENVGAKLNIRVHAAGPNLLILNIGILRSTSSSDNPLPTEPVNQDPKEPTDSKFGVSEYQLLDSETMRGAPLSEMKVNL